MLILKDDDNLPIPIAVGITIGLLASLIQSLGLTIQRKSHVMNERKPDGEKKLEHRRPLWLLGFGIFLSSNILGSLFQIVSLPVVILAPLGAVSLLWNAFFARLILGDVFSPYMIFGTLAIAGGAVLIAIFGIVPEPIHSLDDLLLLLRRSPFVVYFSLLGVTVFVMLALTHITELSLRLTGPSVDAAPQTPRRTLSVDGDARQTTVPVPVLPVSEETALLGGKGGPAGRPSRSIRGTRLLLAVSYASVSGILSGMCLIFAKSGVELLLLTVQGENQFVRWESWALVVGLVVFALLQLWYLHKSLVLANPVLVCPLAFCLYNVSSIINGLVYYDQFGALSGLHIGLVVVGIVVLLGGVWAVSVTSREGGGVEPGTWKVTEEEEEADEEMEEGEAGAVEALDERHSPFDGRSPSRRRTRYGSLLGREGQGGSLSLSIGLSPTSPGFVLRPTRRGMRRTASEGDVERWRWLRHVWRDNGR